MRFKIQLRNRLLKALRALNAFVVTLSLLLSPVANAIQITLGSTMNVRANENNVMKKVGVLAAGSVVEIPDQYKVIVEGKVSAKATFNNWLKEAGYDQRDISKPMRDPTKDFFYPIKIISSADARGAHLVGQTQYMALRVLARSHGRLTVKKDAPVYEPSEILAPVYAGQKLAPARAAPPTTAPALSQTEATGYCEFCDQGHSEAPAAATVESFSGVSRSINGAARDAFNSEATQSQFPALTSGFARECSAYIKPNGEYGDIGQTLLREISQDPAYFDRNNGMNSICPRFSDFTDAQKRNFWVWTYAALATQESGCDPTARSPIFIKQSGGRGASRHTVQIKLNPNGHAAGLTQIPEIASDRAARDRQYGGNFCSGDPYSVDVNTRCSVRIMSTMLRRGTGIYDTNTEYQYWGPLKRSGTLTKKLISQYSACRTGAR